MVEFSEDPQCSLEQDGVFRLRNIVHTTGIERTAIERVSTHLLEEDWRKSWSSSSKKRRRREGGRREEEKEEEEEGKEDENKKKEEDKQQKGKEEELDEETGGRSKNNRVIAKMENDGGEH